MAASDGGATFDAGTAERALDEHRSTSPDVEQLFRIHVGEANAAAVGMGTITGALDRLSYSVCLTVDRGNGTEYLHCGENGWYSITEYPHRAVGPLAIYDHNVSDRLQAYEIAAEKVGRSPFADVELPEHGLDEEEVVLDV